MRPRVSLSVVVAFCVVLLGCAHPSDGLHPSTIEPTQADAIDRIVDGWYLNGLSHEACSAVRQPRFSPDEPEVLGLFAGLRSPVILAFSSPQLKESRTVCMLVGEFECEVEAHVRTVSFRSSRILYAKDNEYASIFPPWFSITETAGGPGVSIEHDHSYVVFANFIEYERPPNMRAMLVCDVSGASALGEIMTEPR